MINFKKNKLNWKELIFYLFFYFNTFIIPAPLVFTNFVSLLWWKKTLSSRFFKIFIIYISTLLIYSIVHIINGVELVYYGRSLFFFILIYFSVIAAILFVERFSSSFEQMFKKINTFGFWLFIVGCIAILTPLESLFWEDHIFANNNVFIRYKGLGYEASYYAYILAPIVIYFFINALLSKFSIKKWLMFLAGLTPVLFTVSFGFFGVFLISLLLSLIIIVIYQKSFPKKMLYPFIIAIIGFGAVMSSNNFISERIVQILKGQDSSINGRTVEAFYLAKEMAKEKNIWFGIGPGQIKVLGEQYIRPFYNYSKDQRPVVTLPNAAAETLAIFGVLGLIVRLGFQIALFFKFNIYKNYYQLILFCFLFVYQFMGSYVTSTGEYVLWVITFMPIFKGLKIAKSSKQSL